MNIAQYRPKLNMRVVNYLPARLVHESPYATRSHVPPAPSEDAVNAELSGTAQTLGGFPDLFGALCTCKNRTAVICAGVLSLLASLVLSFLFSPWWLLLGLATTTISSVCALFACGVG